MEKRYWNNTLASEANIHKAFKLDSKYLVFDIGFQLTTNTDYLQSFLNTVI